MPQATQQQRRVIKNESAKDINSSKTPEMNERDFLNDVLVNEKYITNGLNTFSREASHQQLHEDVQQVLNETHECVRDIFNVMFREGFYELEAADQQKLQEAQKKFTDYLNQQSPYR